MKPSLLEFARARRGAQSLPSLCGGGITMNLIGGSRILVTGGAGFIGSTIVDQLVAAGAAEVRVLDNFVRGNRSNLSAAVASGRVSVIQGDIRDVQLVDHLT